MRSKYVENGGVLNLDKKKPVQTRGLFPDLEQKAQDLRSGMGLEWVWNGSGMGLEWVWNGFGTGLKRVWNGFGTGLERVWAVHIFLYLDIYTKK